MSPVRYSRLRSMALSPAHYAAYAEREQTPAMRFGIAVHALALGGDLIRYDGDRRGNEWAAFRSLVDGADCYAFDGTHRGKAWEAAKEAAAGRPIVTTEDLELAAEAAAIQARRREAGRYDAAIVTTSEYDLAHRCADAVLLDPVARDLLRGQTEVPLQWKSLEQVCGGQLDVIHARGITELKTTTKAEPEWFRRHAIGMAYHAQLAWYSEGAQENGHRCDTHHIVAVESKPPFAVTSFRVTDRALEEGAKMVRLWRERLIACEAAGEWPAYCQSVVELDVIDRDVELIFDEVAA